MEQPKKIDALTESDDEDVGFSRDWVNTDRNVKNEGFRLGMETSQEQALQTGFNAAFKEALQMALAAGKLQGGICANLSYTPAEVLKPGFTPSAQIREYAESQGSSIHTTSRQGFSSSPLQQLLTSNTELVSNIPSLLTNDLVKSISLKLVETRNNDCDDNGFGSCCLKKEPAGQVQPSHAEPSECTALRHVQEASNQGEGQAQQQKGLLSCEHVCSNRSHFWNQLESFKVQAQSLGVVSSND